MLKSGTAGGNITALTANNACSDGIAGFAVCAVMWGGCFQMGFLYQNGSISRDGGLCS
jgi:hypothetical protein